MDTPDPTPGLVADLTPVEASPAANPDHAPGDVAPFRLVYAPGVTPAKWARVWRERLPLVPLELVLAPTAEAVEMLRAGTADAGLLRVPVDDDLSAIPLYAETSVVVVPLEHVIAAFESVSVAELADEVVLHALDDVIDWEQLPGERSALARPATAVDALSLTASEVGVVVLPQSLARLHHRKDLTYRPVTDAPQSQVGLCWVTDRETAEVEELIGIVRGRTANSSRGRTPTQAGAERTPSTEATATKATVKKATVKKAAAAKAAAKKAARSSDTDRRAAQKRKAGAANRGQSQGSAQSKGQSRKGRSR